MKYFLIIALFISSISLFSQKITLDELTKYPLLNADGINDKLLKKNFDFESVKLGESGANTITHWVYKNSNGKTIAHFYYVITPDPQEPGFISYQFAVKKDYLALLDQIKLLGYKKIGSSLQSDAIIEYYNSDKNKNLLKVSVRKIDNINLYIINSYNNQSKEAQRIYTTEGIKN